MAGAARGEAEALCRLGSCYFQGLGVPQSYERAAELWKQAAVKGDAKAQYYLGYLYRDGEGVPTDVALFKQAAAGSKKDVAKLGVESNRSPFRP